MKSDKEHWARVADQWIAWARSPAHDAFWVYREGLARFIGEGSGRALDVGCGEGRVARELKALGYHVTATDVVPAMVEAATQANSADDYAVAGVDDLPFDDGSFDLVMAYNVLMDVDDVPAAVGEIRRVMKLGGTLFISLVHPFRDRGRFDGQGADASFVLDGSYFGREHFDGEEERDGLTMHFAGWSQPLEDYMAALEGAGLAITALREPIPDRVDSDLLRKWARVPLFLWLKARTLA
ncbi:class I SAM-dependent methyltransferase [Aminobacter sp. LjRoot7]|uniref:class I SAM-dependent methyltransferase n=1 Tax=Aminobacter sp. LjRoot7 TaxID=3342335 RepID=UPI003ED04976